MMIKRLLFHVKLSVNLESDSRKGTFIKNVINKGGGGVAKRRSYLISLFSQRSIYLFVSFVES